MKLPNHLAIIMDGNGRWAEAHGRERSFGHLKGARVAKQIVQFCADMNIRYLTLYAFSTENWLRPTSEVGFLMKLLARYVRREREKLSENNIRFRAIGDLDRLPVAVRREVETTIEQTQNNSGLTLTFALSYGGRQEITQAIQAIAADVQTGKIDPKEISEKLISSYLPSQWLPDPDLIIRTSGESRLSNFLLWQSAYSEIHFSPTLWPDFSKSDLENALHAYAKCERRFGRTSAQVQRKELPTLQSVLARTFGISVSLFDSPQNAQTEIRDGPQRV